MHVFIIGSKGIPANYGGFETFVEKLTGGRKDSRIQYHVSCLSDKDSEFYFNGVHCFNVKIPKVGSAAAVIYDILSLQKCLYYLRQYSLNQCLIYLCACRIGPFLALYKRKLGKKNVKLVVNPDGHEWQRSKWNAFIKQYWKISEKLCIKAADHIVCDSRAIENYIRTRYAILNKSTTFIPYGAIISPPQEKPSQNFLVWKKHHCIKNSYYLIVGRFVPENNYEVIFREFIASSSQKDLVVITNVSKNKLYRKLEKSTSFTSYPQIKFVGTVYDENLLSEIRQNAFAYLHGHEVGGTNPSLLESMANTPLNILLDVIFNREVAGNSALFFTKSPGSLSRLLWEAEQLNSSQINHLAELAKMRIREIYSWDLVVEEYETLFKTLDNAIFPGSQKVLQQDQKYDSPEKRDYSYNDGI